MKTLFKVIFLGGALLTWGVLIAWAIFGDRFERAVKEGQSELVGRLADQYIAKNSAPSNTKTQVQTVAGLHQIPIKVEQVSEGIFRATGVANSYLIQTPAGNVLFDTGLATQAARHKRLLQEAAPGKVTHIILSHSHADHIGATKFWRAEFPGAKIITHRRFLDGQRYLTDLEAHFWNRNRLLYTFMPEEPPADDSLFAYGGITPDILLSDSNDYRFTLGGTEFVILPTPGAEGEDNIVLWLPTQKVLFSGDFFGPLFPMMPNLFTLRGEKFRDPLDYVRSLQTVLGLQAELILPSHLDPIKGGEKIASDIKLMHDATLYVHDQTIAGMNAGRSVWQLMQEISLPDALKVSQGHGKVSWNVRSIWEYYSTWFKFDSTTELYAVPISTLYPELAQLAGGAPALTELAQLKLNNQHAEQALHLVELALSASPEHIPALKIRLGALELLLERAWQTTSNFSETGWLQSRIKATQDEIETLEQ